MRLYNSLTGKKEKFVPVKAGEVSIYACGVTVYDHCHVGHARGAVFFDVLRRYFEHRGLKVTYVRNFTDVDDKIIRRAHEEGVSWREIANRYIEAHERDMGALGVRPATIEPKATDHIGEIIALVRDLEERGLAYAAGGDVFFRVRRFPGYGRLSGKKIDELESGARIEVNEVKEDPLDFALWKGSKAGEPAWESPWGLGRPGWHIECSAMSMAILGREFDIHGGGRDLLFPHHENEIAQSCGAGAGFAHCWVHNGFVNINNEKMSKSLGNFFTIREILDRFPAEVVRLFLLSTHYRSPIDFSDRALAEARAAVDRVYSFLRGAVRAATGDWRAAGAELVAAVDGLAADFDAAMEDDLNTAAALAAIFERVRLFNRVLTEGGDAAGQAVAAAAAAQVRRLGAVLGLFQDDPEGWFHAGVELDEQQIEARIGERLAARAAKAWARADAIRDELAAAGIVLEDRAGTTTWRRG
ncbi:MAG: cysteine--tRNA ligase [Deltaproteobacteria bacterium]|nr:cysteine--tRNA ligase [Deltaproteobacteria bacterium]NCS74707.1 cysteine--tRNA ligase [Deltaproteobacteria bacterium]OIP66156.1 MAG: cysteine--tRNA ligase [Nitrospirae bacterium CG2_30_70_394]PIW83844.1 MAG: cysteine--tRNA ligase [Nitrospirae bacterium CG_4_8_14_3_um_filter_70_85]PIX83916.1 MAG: cysteine--tRNA ligase [Nitrospirae bacterium CG_4_10_14_3_um_filter_70_108]